MPRAHSVPAVAAPDLDAALALLRANGLRVSAARRLVLEALYATDDPLTAERIAAGLDGRVPRSDPGSVYRNLETLESVGLVRHFHLGHGAGLYVRSSVGAREYLTCDSCGAVRALEPRALDGVRALIRKELGWEARFSHFPIAGMCPSCASASLRVAGEEEPHAHP